MKKGYNDELAGTIREMASGIYHAGLMPKSTRREIEALCLSPIETFTPEQIKAIRARQLAVIKGGLHRLG